MDLRKAMLTEIVAYLIIALGHEETAKAARTPQVGEADTTNRLTVGLPWGVL